MWRQSGINHKISIGDLPIVNGWFLGDSGYPLCPHLLTPILSPNTPGERRYNPAFLKTRKTIECAFGLWKSRWRAMHRTGGTLCYNPDRVCRLVIATMVLHNICINHSISWESEILPEIEDIHDGISIDPVSSGQLVRQSVIEEYFKQILSINSEKFKSCL